MHVVRQRIIRSFVILLLILCHILTWHDYNIWIINVYEYVYAEFIDSQLILVFIIIPDNQHYKDICWWVAHICGMLFK